MKLTRVNETLFCMEDETKPPKQSKHYFTIGGKQAADFLMECFNKNAVAPVQAQEPVAETYAHTMSNGRGRPDDPAPFETVCIRLLRNDLPADLKLYAAPVLPVAVPDGWKLVPRELSEDHLREVMGNINRKYKGDPLGEDFTRLVWQWAIHASPAAPAARDDVLIESNLREIIAKTSDDYARYVAQTTLAAIAAKAVTP